MDTDANAPGGHPRLSRIRGLDGIRAFSVLAIIAFHTGLNSVPGGFYGVDSFFVLSGFLITSLLVKEWAGTGTIRLRRFWAGRARRLLPALFLLIAVIGIVLTVVPRILATPHILGDALSAIFYVSNWYSIHAGASYFSLSSQPSPLLHTWSLAIEEQFYLVWPLVVLGVLKLGTAGPGPAPAARRTPGPPTRRRRAQRRSIPVLGGGRLVLGGPAPARADPAWVRRRRLQFSLRSPVSVRWPPRCSWRWRPPTGTPPRLLRHGHPGAGVARRRGYRHRADALARAEAAARGSPARPRCSPSPVWPGRPRCGPRRRRPRRSPSAAGSCWPAWRRAGSSSAARWRPARWWSASWNCRRCRNGVGSPTASISGTGPCVLVMSGQRLHWGPYPLFLARVAVTAAIAAVSYELVEMPIRRGALGALALLGGGARRGGGRHQHGVRQHARPGGGGRAAGDAAAP